jgi:putative membrane protein
MNRQESPESPSKPAAGISPTDPRVYLAEERTLLAWIRTGLALMGFGFVVARFGLFLREISHVDEHLPHQPYGLALWFGTGLVLLGVCATGFAGFRYKQDVRRMDAGEPFVRRSPTFGVTVATSLALIGLAMAGYLLLR